MQWRNEIELHTDNLLKTLVWHGASRQSSVKELKKYDVVSFPYLLMPSGTRLMTRFIGPDILCCVGELLPEGA